jgi:predicted nucleotidyltransferase
MRLDDKIVFFFKQTIGEKVPGATIYLFGSRTNDDALGGDIDLMILTENLVDKKIIRSIRIEFFKKFGWQKVDLVNFTFADTSVFKQLIQFDAVEL